MTSSRIASFSSAAIESHPKRRKAVVKLKNFSSFFRRRSISDSWTL
jgi:hypothetical protein